MRQTPRTRNIENLASQWAAEATPRGQDCKAYLVRTLIPTLLPALIKLIKHAELSAGQVPSADDSQSLEEQSRVLLTYLQRSVVPTLNRCLKEVATSRPSDPVDTLARRLFEESEDEKLEEEFDDELNPIHWCVRGPPCLPACPPSPLHPSIHPSIHPPLPQYISHTHLYSPSPLPLPGWRSF